MKDGGRKERPAFGRSNLVVEETGPAAPAGISADHVLDIVSRAGIIFFRWSPSTGLSYVSDSAQELLGWGMDDFRREADLGQKIIHPDSRAAMAALLEDFAESRASCVATELKMQTRNGREVWLEARMMPTYGPAGEILEVSGVAFDATALVEARDEGAEGWDHYRKLFEDAPVAMWLVNPDTSVVLEANALACAMHGAAPGELDGVPLEQLVAPEEWETTKERLARWQGSAKVEIVARTVHRRKDGTRIPVQVAGGQVRVSGRLRRLSFLEDLSRREAVGGEARLTRAAADAASDAALVLDAAGRIVFANAAAQALVGRPAEELLGQAPESLILPPLSNEAWGKARAAAAAGERSEGAAQVAGPGEALQSVDIEFRPVRDEAGAVTHTVAVLRPSAIEAVEAAKDEHAESELFLALLHRHVEDLMAAARREISKALEAESPPGQAAGRGLTAWQSVDQAEEFLRVFHDLSDAAARGAPWSPTDGAREVGEVVEEAAMRARPVFAGRTVAVHRKMMVRAAVAHASLAREVVVNLIVEAGLSAEPGPLRVEVMGVPAEIDELKAVKIVVQGPAAFSEPPRERVALCQRAAEAMGATLLAAQVDEARGVHTRFELRLPLV